MFAGHATLIGGMSPDLTSRPRICHRRVLSFLDGLGWNWIICSKGNVWVQWSGEWIPLALLGKRRPAQLGGAVDYGRRASGGPYAGRLVVYANQTHADPWFLLVSAGLADLPVGAMVASVNAFRPNRPTKTKRTNAARDFISTV